MITYLGKSSYNNSTELYNVINENIKSVLTTKNGNNIENNFSISNGNNLDYKADKSNNDQTTSNINVNSDKNHSRQRNSKYGSRKKNLRENNLANTAKVYNNCNINNATNNNVYKLHNSKEKNTNIKQVNKINYLIKSEANTSKPNTASGLACNSSNNHPVSNMPRNNANQPSNNVISTAEGKNPEKKNININGIFDTKLIIRKIRKVNTNEGDNSAYSKLQVKNIHYAIENNLNSDENNLNNNNNINNLQGLNSLGGNKERKNSSINPEAKVQAKKINNAIATGTAKANMQNNFELSHINNYINNNNNNSLNNTNNLKASNQLKISKQKNLILQNYHMKSFVSTKNESNPNVNAHTNTNLNNNNNTKDNSNININNNNTNNRGKYQTSQNYTPLGTAYVKNKIPSFISQNEAEIDLNNLKFRNEENLEMLKNASASPNKNAFTNTEYQAHPTDCNLQKANKNFNIFNDQEFENINVREKLKEYSASIASPLEIKDIHYKKNSFITTISNNSNNIFFK